jgi:hypothetical protein
MWRIKYKQLALQEVLMMAYMNVLEALETLSLTSAAARNFAPSIKG